MKRSVPAVTLALVLGLAAAGCGGSDDEQAAASSPAASATSSATASPTTVGSRPADPLAGGSVPPVVRDGRTPAGRLTAATASLSTSGSGTVRYRDGVRLVVTRVHQGEVTGQGPGVIRGPRTTFDLRLTNRSSSSIDLDQVVVTLVYGRPARTAQPVYDTDAPDSARDFSGLVAPGRAATASYSFAIPGTGRSAVSVHVDFDAVHAAAVFAGSVG